MGPGTARHHQAQAVLLQESCRANAGQSQAQPGMLHVQPGPQTDLPNNRGAETLEDAKSMHRKIHQGGLGSLVTTGYLL